VVLAGEISAYCTNEFFEVLGLYQLTKIMGNPNGAVGWANEPLAFVEAFLALESEDNAIQREEMDKRERESASKTGKTKPKGIFKRRR
jgi:hypothetical protein